MVRGDLGGGTWRIPILRQKGHPIDNSEHKPLSPTCGWPDSHRWHVTPHRLALPRRWYVSVHAVLVWGGVAKRAPIQKLEIFGGCAIRGCKRLQACLGHKAICQHYLITTNNGCSQVCCLAVRACDPPPSPNLLDMCL